METKTTNSTIQNEVLEGTKKKQATSKSYLVRQFGLNVSKLKETGLIDEKDFKTLKEIHEKAVKQYIGYQLL